MDKLSFLIRREADISTRYGQIERLYDIADRVEALEAIAKRYEDAPVEEVGALPGTNGGFGAVCLPREYVGHRVRIIREEAV